MYSMDGLRELDRMHHETDLGEQACMFFHAKKLPYHAREFSGTHIGHRPVAVGRKDSLNVSAYLEPQTLAAF